MISRPTPDVPPCGIPEDVLAMIGEGTNVIVPLAEGEPPALLDVLEAHNESLRGVRVHQMHALEERRYIWGEFSPRMRHVSYFLSGATRAAYSERQCDLVPAHFSEVPALLRRLSGPLVVMARAAPPDRHGYFSLGTNADYTASFIGQVPSSEPSEEERRIGELVAERIEDGSTIQIGIGTASSGVLRALSGHRHLGVHTELFSDGLMDLVDRGVVTGTRKRLRRNKVVTTFCLGSHTLYSWLHENAAVELLPVEWVNDPRVIGREPRFVSVNATAEVDLFGQCASETVGGRYWSGSGGQADFARGAMYSEGGQAFLVLRSVTHDGRPRIRARLSEGSVVTTLKNTVDHVVTEWGVATLRGRTVSERARALIAIAHPDTRDALEAEARSLGLLDC